MTNPCPTCHNTHPDGSTHSAGVNQTVPRVAASLDDLRVGMVIVAEAAEGWSYPDVVTEDDFRNVDWWNDSRQVVILSDPPPEPVTVSREAFDRLAEEVDHYDGIMDSNEQRTRFIKSARALADEVRATP